MLDVLLQNSQLIDFNELLVLILWIHLGGALCVALIGMGMLVGECVRTWQGPPIRKPSSPWDGAIAKSSCVRPRSVVAIRRNAAVEKRVVPLHRPRKTCFIYRFGLF